MLGAGNFKLTLGGFTLDGIGTATFGAIILYHLLERGGTPAESREPPAAAARMLTLRLPSRSTALGDSRSRCPAPHAATRALLAIGERGELAKNVALPAMQDSQPKQTLPPQTQERQPGRETEMHPKPDLHAALSGQRAAEDKVAIVTGGDSGIGRAVAVLFAREGADVAIVYLKEGDDARETGELVEAEGRAVPRHRRRCRRCRLLREAPSSR